MKRKLNQDDVPTPVSSPPKKQAEPSFRIFGFDPRLLQATVKEGFNAPTLVQIKAIPLALEGKDILGMRPRRTTIEELANTCQPVRAKTGSGKTAAYLLPLLELIVRRKNVRIKSAVSRAFANPLARMVRLRRAQPPSSFSPPMSWPNRPRKSWPHSPHSVTKT